MSEAHNKQNTTRQHTTPTSYTSKADFNTGNYTSVSAETVPGTLVLNKFTATPFPLLWVPISGRGTVARVHTGTGAILGEYYSAPDGRGRCVRGM